MRLCRFEDPIPSTDIEGLIELRAETDLPVEVGEFLYSIQGFAEYIRRDALDIVRLISDNVGGITGSFRVGLLADAFGMPCTPHNWGNGFDLAVHMQLELALPNGYWFEMPYPPTLTDRAYLNHQFRLDKDGYVNAPPGPGLGVTSITTPSTRSCCASTVSGGSQPREGRIKGAFVPGDDQQFAGLSLAALATEAVVSITAHVGPCKPDGLRSRIGCGLRQERSRRCRRGKQVPFLGLLGFVSEHSGLSRDV